MASGEVALSVEHLSKRFRLFHERNQTLKQSILQRRRARYEDFWALRDVTFEVMRGETFGIVGHNGSGKSTLLKCLTKILQPDEGSLVVNGSVSALLELGAGFHYELSGRENVYLNAAILGVSRRDINARFDDIVAFSGLEQFIDTPVKNYSSGMFVRLGFAVAINVDPEVLIIDEVLAVGDAEFQAKCGDKIAEFRDRGKTIVLVTHGMSDVTRICQRAAWLDHGNIKMIGEPNEIVDAYMGSARDGRSVQNLEGLRWGSGEVQIDEIDLLDSAGQPAAFARTGEAHSFRLRLRADELVDRPRVAISVFDQNGLLVSGVDTFAREFSIEQLHGTSTLSFCIDSLPLLEGTYELSCSVRDHTGQRELDFRSKCLRFDVLRGLPHDAGLVTLGGHWDVGP